MFSGLFSPLLFEEIEAVKEVVCIGASHTSQAPLQLCLSSSSNNFLFNTSCYFSPYYSTEGPGV